MHASTCLVPFINNKLASKTNDHRPSRVPMSASNLEGDEKLAVVCVGALVGHAQQPVLVVPHERLVRKLVLQPAPHRRKKKKNAGRETRQNTKRQNRRKRSPLRKLRVNGCKARSEVGRWKMRLRESRRTTDVGILEQVGYNLWAHLPPITSNWHYLPARRHRQCIILPFIVARVSEH